ncbi:hypothetical protein AB1N83_010998 [Pleurotus pulmonarius]
MYVRPELKLGGIIVIDRVWAFKQHFRIWVHSATSAFVPTIWLRQFTGASTVLFLSLLIERRPETSHTSDHVKTLVSRKSWLQFYSAEILHLPVRRSFLGFAPAATHVCFEMQIPQVAVTRRPGIPAILA